MRYSVVRQPAVAGQFYPANPLQLQETVNRLLPQAGTAPQPAFGLMVPHAGYIYSGAIAAQTFSTTLIPRRIALLGPNHHGYGHPSALSGANGWQTPLGTVQLDDEVRDLMLGEDDLIAVDEAAHRQEHSLEVQLPIVQSIIPDLLVTPLSLKSQPLENLLCIADRLAGAVSSLDDSCLLVASSDMNHFESAEISRDKDFAALDAALALDAEGLFHTVVDRQISMCGMLAMVVVIAACRQLGACRGELVRYGHSGEVNGDLQEVVGYAGVRIV